MDSREVIDTALGRGRGQWFRVRRQAAKHRQDVLIRYPHIAGDSTAPVAEHAASCGA
ncbi:hypothetical protein SAMN02982929_06644 [Saccharopolyspora kobensis]|uniref:Uncharacterized protein n=1 Tax=Saccharopolyspora kobensis TaxID=146035 RepID=A0A1H6EH25_9PSEU|nr:hypothetical protein SAMN02982929_06644 [Saccharopolyspora kobensis]SFE66481.1 hypothetical protein SAMN05216506_113100 [Saccharopolyspora kobensis]